MTLVKAKFFIGRKKLKQYVTQDHTQSLKYDVPTRFHKRLESMWTYLSRYDNIISDAEEVNVLAARLPRVSLNELNNLEEFIAALQVRRVARQLEADRKVTISRAPRITRELYETLLIMAGNLSKMRVDSSLKKA